MSRRAAALVSQDAREQEIVSKLVKELYDIRSAVVHGSRLSDKSRKWLIENCAQVELRVRQTLVAALQRIPPGDAERRPVLAELYDPDDDDRGASALQAFHQIKTDTVRKTIAAKIAKLVGG
jgi:hypothetical protein